MAISPNTINLIQTKTSTSPQFEAIEQSIRKSALAALVIFICTAVVIGSVYFYYSYTLEAQAEQRRTLITTVNSLKNKEAYLLAIKDRTKTVEKVMASQKPWVHMLDLVYSFATPPTLMSISVDEQDRINITLASGTLEQILQIIQSIIQNVQDGKIQHPQLKSFQLGKNGNFQVSISFYAVFAAL